MSKIKAERRTSVRAPAAPRTEERKLAKFLQAMTARLAKDWTEQFPLRSEVFQDAATPPHKRLAQQISKRFREQFDDAEIERQIRGFFETTNKRSRGVIFRQLEKKIGISSAQLIAEETLQDELDKRIDEVVEQIRGLNDDTLNFFTENTAKAIESGKGLPEVMKVFEDMEETRVDHAAFVARNSINNFNAVMMQARSKSLGIDGGRWLTTGGAIGNFRSGSRGDSRARPSHKDRHGKLFELSKGLWSAVDQKFLLPGVDFNCRCDTELIIPAG